MYDETHYEVIAHDSSGNRLSLNEDRAQQDEIRAGTVWEAVAALVSVPSHGWMHWDDGESERIVIGRVMLRHLEVRHGNRGSVTYSTNTLEVIDRTG